MGPSPRGHNKFRRTAQLKRKRIPYPNRRATQRPIRSSHMGLIRQSLIALLRRQRTQRGRRQLADRCECRRETSRRKAQIQRRLSRPPKAISATSSPFLPCQRYPCSGNRRAKVWRAIRSIFTAGVAGVAPTGGRRYVAPAVTRLILRPLSSELFFLDKA